MFDASSVPPPLWSNGPRPGERYDFPNMNPVSVPQEPIVHSKGPITTASSIVAITFNKGAIIAGDILASYGSLARYRNCPRVIKVNNNIIFGASGDYADFQYMRQMIEQKIIDEECLDDGFTLKPKSLHCWLTRVMYNRRNKFDPLWNEFVVGGMHEGAPFLGTVDKLGTAYQDNVICTGFGAYLATPLLRNAKDAKPDMNLDEAKEQIQKCLEVLYYRDARSFHKYTMATITADGVVIEGPLDVKQNWTVAHFNKSE